MLARFRGFIFLPIIKILTFMRITPNMVTCLGVFVMIIFVFFVRLDLKVCSFLLLLAILLDLLDGPLARHQNLATDKGKFIDGFADIIVFFLFVLGLVYGGLLAGWSGVILIFGLIFSKIFRFLYNAKYFKSDWHFKTVAGIFPNFFAGLLYLAFIVYGFYGNNYLFNLSVIASILLFLDIIFFYHKILSERQ